MAKTCKIAKLTKKQVKDLKEKLALTPVSVWDKADAATRQEIFKLGESYKAFLSQAKTERLAVEAIRERAKGLGFKPLKPGAKGRRFYLEQQGKAIALCVLGKKGVAAGARIIGSHIDAPRLDLKMHPLYENLELAFLKTHYYGGVKKYQWLARPLALHGVVCTREGKTVQVHVGDAPEDPVFTLLDLLPHLSRKSQESKKLSDAFEAERMNLLIGGLPLDMEEGAGNDKVKLAVLKLMQERYGVTEADLISAELEIVPAGGARDVGLDRSMVGSYGQDDRASAFCALEAILTIKDPAVTAIAMFVDKEEIGSEGPTSANTRWIELVMASCMEAAGEKPGYLAVGRALAASQALSADVNAALDPDYPEVHEKRNAALMGYGVTLTKYTGHGGKYGANDANAEYVAWLRKVWDQAGVTWQAAGMGKIDEGGGGTIAKLMAVYGLDIVDVGPALLSMHSPFEVSHKADIFSSVAAFRAFYQAGPR
jgi:aspartyl aminopeptidase